MAITSRFAAPVQKKSNANQNRIWKSARLSKRAEEDAVFIPLGATILIDTANVLARAHQDLPEIAPVDVLRSVEVEFERIGFVPVFMMESSTLGWACSISPLNKVEPLRQFCHEKVSFVWGQADEPLLETAAHSTNTFILSNDKFRDYASRYPQLVGSSRILPYLVETVFAQALSIVGMGSLVFLSTYEDAEVEPEEQPLLAPEFDCIEPREVMPVTERASETIEGLCILRKKAADHDPHAFEVLATYYAEGRGVDCDFKKSACLDRAAQVAQKRAWQVGRRHRRQRANQAFLPRCA